LHRFSTVATIFRPGFLLFVILFGCSPSIELPDPTERNGQELVCPGRDSTEIIKEQPMYRPSPEVSALVEYITKFHSANIKFEIFCTDLPKGTNAQAMFYQRRQIIAYEWPLEAKLADSSERQWDIVAVLAHEIAHHMLGHTLDLSNDRKRMELDADRFAGHTIGIMRGEQDDAMKAINQYINDQQQGPEYPSKTARKKAARDGWTRAISLALDPIQNDLLNKNKFRSFSRP